MIIKLVKNIDLDNNLQSKIIALKSQHWPYDTQSQKQWMKNNLNDDDIHVCVISNMDIIAYLNLVNLVATTENMDFNLMGIGNVCVDLKHQKMGWGNLLLCIVNILLKEYKKTGILFCRQELVQFYQRNNWICADPRTLKVMVGIKIVEDFCMFSEECQLTGTLYLDRIF